MNLQCILCKYKNNEQACHNAIYSSSWTCPTLSNIYYGKLIDWFPFNIFHHIKTKIKFKEMEKFPDSECIKKIGDVWVVKLNG